MNVDVRRHENGIFYLEVWPSNENERLLLEIAAKDLGLEPDKLRGSWTQTQEVHP